MERRPGIGALLLLALGAWLLLQPGCGSNGGSGDADGPRAGSSVMARVVRVVDGDTIVARVGGRNEYVRYIGVDTPETVKPDTPVQCFGPDASDENHRLVEGRTVRLTFDREVHDDYGRLLAYVHLGKRFVNAELVRDGYARTLAIAPNTSHAGEFQRLAAKAARAGRGLWGAC
ncbi:MAG: thermonuclease family protein [Solirubrobacterales bacterium]